MEKSQKHTKYIKWLSPEEMHKDSLLWLSELNFMKDEHLFLTHLIKTFTLELLELKDFSSDKEIVDVLNRSQRQNDSLISSIQKHEKELEIMVDGFDQLEEETKYKEIHRKLIEEIHQYKKDYQILKTQLFDIIKGIKKEEKQRYLFDKNH